MHFAYGGRPGGISGLACLTRMDGRCRLNAPSFVIVILYQWGIDNAAPSLHQVTGDGYRGRDSSGAPRLHFAAMARCDRRLTHPLLSSWQGNFNANAADIARQLFPQLKGFGSKHVMYGDMGRDGQKLFSPASSPARCGKWYPAIVPVSATARRSQVAKTLGSHLVVFAAKSLAVLGVTGCWCIAG